MVFRPIVPKSVFGNRVCLAKGGEYAVWHRTTPVLYLVICASLAHKVKGYMGMGELESPFA